METLINRDNCNVIIYRQWLSNDEANKYFELASKLHTENKIIRRQMNMYGKNVYRSRVSYACGAEYLEGQLYPESDIVINKWPPEIEYLQSKIYNDFHHFTDSCLINGYLNGSDYFYPHSDKECKDPLQSVLMLSTGASRDFHFIWNESKEKIKTVLNNGDLLIMYGDTNNKLKHT